MKPTACLIIAAALLAGGCEKKPQVVSKPPPYEAFEPRLEAASDAAFQAAKQALYNEWTAGKDEAALTKEILPGKAQAAAIRFKDAKDRSDKSRAACEEKMKELAALEKQFRAMKPPGKALRQYCLSDDIERYRRYGWRVVHQSVNDEKFGETLAADHRAIFDEALRVSMRMTLEEIRSGDYESPVVIAREIESDRRTKEAMSRPR